MRIKLHCYLLISFLVTSFSYAQNSDVQITVKWGNNSYENKVEVYNTANDLIATICDDNQCYVSSQQGVTNKFGAKYDLGCVTNGNNYYIKMYDIANNGWQSGYVIVTVAGIDVINDNGASASTSGSQLFFNVAGGDATCNTQLDTDQDGLADYLDYDDDGDGIPDGPENLGQDRFECTLPELKFENGAYDASVSTGSIGNVGSVYRFGNAIQGYDVLMEITELTNATIANIDDDSVDNPTYLQTELNLIGAGTPGATFQFTIVNAGTTTPSAEIFRVNGITWDCDGSGSLKESVIYYNPAAYGTENPSSLETMLIGSDVQISASGLQEGPGFSTLKVLRAYYQFIGNSFTMRMQGLKTSTGTTKRQFGMSFTQCEFLDFNANSLIIITGEDFDQDGKYNHLDLDSDNDGIPDNVEGQPTLGYILPNGTINIKTGIDIAYGDGIVTVDTDKDNTPDVLDLDTDGDGIPDIEENGMANEIIVFSDADNDGLDQIFEGSVAIDPLDVNDDIDSPQASILPDVDGDLFIGGDLDYRDIIDVYYESATIDFDGSDDYLSRDGFLDGLAQVTLMAWVKSDVENTGTVTIAGEDRGCKLYLANGNRVYFSLKTDGGSIRTVSGSIINYNEWHHITGTYSSATGDIKLYVDGKLRKTLNTGSTGSSVDIPTTTNGAFEIGRYSRDVSNQEYFKGCIDEVRVFDTALSDEQIQQMVYQEIENNSGAVRGKILPKDIQDTKTLETVPWTNLIAYYPMTAIKTSTTADYSGNNRTLKLKNITTLQAQTAPMPYVSNSDGSWTSESTWLHGDVWDIEDVNSNQEWSIVSIKNNISTSGSHTHLGLLVDPNKTLTVNGDNKIENTLYLELNGTIDLQGDSQLLQGMSSDLVTSSTGRILRRQEGNSSFYWYNYWSSPVGILGATGLTNNNGTTHNTNNSSFKLNTLKNADGSGVQFTTDYHQLGKISKQWLYTYKNGVEYWDYEAIHGITPLEPGIGYTQKGTGGSTPEQQYIFEGKPNNGTIEISVTDTGGSGSVPAVTKTDYLLGNPYASALDLHAFIDDNEGVIDGTIQLWQQWSGTSHILDEYNGGYAQVNKTGSVRAYQFVGIEGATNGNQDGTKTPTRYLPVGQGFMAEIVSDGTVVFKNSQRVFIKESDANGNYNNGSVFFRNAAESEPEADSSDENTLMQTIRLEFQSVDGPATRRELLLGFSDFTTDGYDYGYDAKNVEDTDDDLNLLLEDQLMSIQAYGPITADKIVPLALRTSGTYNYRIRLTDFVDIEEDQELYLRDNLTGYYFDLRTDQAYEFTSEPGEFNSRFEIVFQNEDSLSTQQSDYQYNLIYFDNTSDKLYVKGLESDVDQLMLINILGQTIREYTSVTASDLDNGLEISNVSTGTYVVYFRIEGRTETKKIIIN